MSTFLLSAVCLLVGYLQVDAQIAITYGGNAGGAPCRYSCNYGWPTRCYQTQPCRTGAPYGSVPWCYTEHENWGYCRSHGSEQGSPILTAGGTAGGAPCRFPFNYDSNTYRKCTVDDSQDFRKWCCTAGCDMGSGKDFRWGYCQDSTTSTAAGTTTAFETTEAPWPWPEMAG